jgi:hypothetical protein
MLKIIRRILLWLILVFLYKFSFSFSQILPLELKAFDTPNDQGESITISWDFSTKDSLQIFRKKYDEVDFSFIKEVSGEEKQFLDESVKNGVKYFYKVQLKNNANQFKILGPVFSSPQWFNTKRTKVLVGLAICIGIIISFLFYSKKTKNLFIRKIAGLEAIDDAVGRATEMGKPILYSSGLGSMERIATMASMNILGSVAEKVAEYNTPLIFPNYDPMVMTVAQEVVKESYNRAGHPDAFQRDNIFFVTQSQFGYVAAVDGIIVREKPATNLFIGTFEAESLILAETGNSIGAIQIAGTDSTIQLSFFMVACDYTLIGEELFAASGYLAKDPMILGSIKGQDWLKIIISILVILGSVLATFEIGFLSNLFSPG